MASGTRTRDWSAVDFYGVLGITPDATDDDIGRAFRTLAKQLHPDAGATLRDAERFKQVSAAYAVLGDAVVRREYDLVRFEPAAPAPPPVVRTSVAPAPVPSFRAAKPGKGWTRSRSWLAVVGGVLVFAAGIAVAIWVAILRSRSGDPGYEVDPARDITIGIVAAKLIICGPVFTVLGVMHLHRT
jgi:DnaJ domain